MSERNWTAGPWRVEGGMSEEKGYVVAKLDMHSYVMAEHEAVNDSRHDAHLIAAAPDMAEYIKKKADEGCSEAQQIWRKCNDKL